MTVSINGWPVPPKELKKFKVPGANRNLVLDKNAGRPLIALVADYHKTVRAIDEGPTDEGGYVDRDARAVPGKKSNHASGTAVDINWSEEGAQNSNWGKKFFNNAANAAKVLVLKQRYGKIIQWGGDWNAKDYMHWEIKPGISVQDVLDFCNKKGIDENGVRKGA